MTGKLWNPLCLENGCLLRSILLPETCWILFCFHKHLVEPLLFYYRCTESIYTTGGLNLSPCSQSLCFSILIKNYGSEKQRIQLLLGLQVIWSVCLWLEITCIGCQKLLDFLLQGTTFRILLLYKRLISSHSFSCFGCIPYYGLGLTEP